MSPGLVLHLQSLTAFFVSINRYRDAQSSNACSPRPRSTSQQHPDITSMPLADTTHWASREGSYQAYSSSWAVPSSSTTHASARESKRRPGMPTFISRCLDHSHLIESHIPKILAPSYFEPSLGGAPIDVSMASSLRREPHSVDLREHIEQPNDSAQSRGTGIVSRFLRKCNPFGRSKRSHSPSLGELNIHYLEVSCVPFFVS